MKIKKKQSKRSSPYNGSEIWEKDELISVIKYERSRRNKAIVSLLCLLTIGVRFLQLILQNYRVS